MTKMKKEITVNAPVDIVYGAWHNFENLPRFMDNLEEVRVVSGNRSHWKAKGPLGMNAEWDAEMTLDDPNKAIGWRSIEGGSSLTNAGRVNFQQEGSATRIEVTIEYDAPAGPLGDVVAKIFSNPEKQVEGDLQRFREAIERGADASGFVYGNSGGSSDALGSSLGAATASDLESIDRLNSGIAPEHTDDPAQRKEAGADFGHGSKELPKVG